MIGEDAALVGGLLELGRAGCQGNSQDFECWLRYLLRQPAPGADVSRTLDRLVAEGHFLSHPEYPGEYLIAGQPEFDIAIEYQVSGNLQDSPIQMVRSRLERFLRFHRIAEEDVIDLTIATTEAIENAVKYSDHTAINVFYELRGGEFFIRIVNWMDEVIPEKDIESGKYSPATTLMRGMMVMVKLFDNVDLDISDERRQVIFSASRKLRPAA
ncbi:MAG: ATP-binding protein [Leptospirales bacterium]|nr:ATP-binding protein [Leptospirales bacterium]